MKKFNWREALAGCQVALGALGFLIGLAFIAFVGSYYLSQAFGFFGTFVWITLMVAVIGFIIGGIDSDDFEPY